MELFVAGELPPAQDRIGLKLRQKGNAIEVVMVNERGIEVDAPVIGDFFPNDRGKLRFRRAQSANYKYTTQGAVEVV